MMMPKPDKGKHFDSVGDMSTALEQTKTGHLYGKKPSPDKAARISAIVRNGSAMFADSLLQGAAKLTDDNLEDIAERSRAYLSACVEKSVVPNWMSFCNFALGWTRRGVEGHIRNNPQTQVSKFLVLFRDSLASIMLDAGLMRDTSEILTIFSLRNMNGFSGGDAHEMLPEAAPDTQTAEEILTKYGDLLV